MVDAADVKRLSQLEHENQWLRNRIDARIVIEDWRREYNASRPHSSLNSLTPAEFATRTSIGNPELAIF
jgi:transposase InsO family protein